MNRTIGIALLASLLTPLPAFAAHWNVDHARSRLGFSVAWSSEPFSAAFKSWKADIEFDPADLQHASAIVTIDLASEASDEPDFDDGLKGAQGFQTAQFPRARFTTRTFVHKSGNEYIAMGTLSLRGITREVTLPFTLAIAGHTAHMTGSAQIMRTDFGVGQGIWAAPSPVGHDVTVTVDLVATRS